MVHDSMDDWYSPIQNTHGNFTSGTCAVTDAHFLLLPLLSFHFSLNYFFFFLFDIEHKKQHLLKYIEIRELRWSQNAANVIVFIARACSCNVMLSALAAFARLLFLAWFTMYMHAISFFVRYSYYHFFYIFLLRHTHRVCEVCYFRCELVAFRCVQEIIYFCKNSLRMTVTKNPWKPHRCSMALILLSFSFGCPHNNSTYGFRLKHTHDALNARLCGCPTL